MALAHQPGEQGRDSLEGGDPVHGHALRRAAGHTRVQRLLRVLHDRQPAQRLDVPQPGRAVVARAGEDHAHDPGPVGPGGGAEQHVHRGPVSVLARPARQLQASRLHHHVVVGRGDVDPPRRELLTVGRGLGGQRPGPVEQLGQQAGAAGQHVKHDQHRRPQVAREVAHQGEQRLHASRRGADHHEVVAPVRLGRGGPPGGGLGVGHECSSGGCSRVRDRAGRVEDRLPGCQLGQLLAQRDRVRQGIAPVGHAVEDSAGLEGQGARVASV